MLQSWTRYVSGGELSNLNLVVHQTTGYKSIWEASGIFMFYLHDSCTEWDEFKEREREEKRE